MTLELAEIRSAGDKEWDAIWQQCEYATYFDSREWALIWSKYSNNQIYPNPSVLVFSDNSKLLLPFSEKRCHGGLFTHFLLTPAGTYGGWLSIEKLSSDHAPHCLSYLNSVKNLTWRMNPFDPLSRSIDFRDSCFDETHVVFLEKGFDNIYKDWSKGHRSAVKKAKNKGLHVREAQTIEDWETYFTIYQHALERWGECATSRYDCRLFRIIRELNSTDIKLWLAIHEQHVIAGALCLYAKKHVGYWHGAALSEYFSLRPVHLLMYHVIRHAYENRYCWFDFNPSGGHEGVKAFKEHFGTTAMPSPIVNRQSFSKRILDRIVTWV